MKNVYSASLAICSLCLLVLLSASKSTYQVDFTTNPLFPKFNQPIDFKQVKTEHIPEATLQAIEQAKTILAKLYAIKEGKHTYQNTMLALDDAKNSIIKKLAASRLLLYTHPDASIRNEAQKSMATLAQFMNEINLDEKIYKAVKAYSLSKEAQELTGDKKKYVKGILQDFERNGLNLPADERDQLKQIQDKITTLSIAFDKNIASYKDSLLVTEAEMNGLPEEYKQTRKVKEGLYSIDLSYPSYIAFMGYSTSDQARKRLHYKFNNRAADKNLQVLKQLLIERQKMAHLLKFNTYAAYAIGDKMAKSPEVVWDFENKLLEKVKLKAKKDYQELLEVKKAYSKDNTVKEVYDWERYFYNNLLLKEKYGVDAEKVNEYFELNKVIDGLFKISQHLFDIEFIEIKQPSTWHPDVQLFEVKQQGKLIGHFYLDLHPRANKYTHNACAPLQAGKITFEGRQLPAAVLICNFTRPTADKPALLPHREVITFFHEFGHVLHWILYKGDVWYQSSPGIKKDFVEAPSQIFENWAWNYEALKLFDRHYKTGELLPEELFTKMLAARNVGSGIDASRQIGYGMLDLTLYDKFDPNGKETTTDVTKRIAAQVLLFPYQEGTHFETSFSHLTGYGANYYGYLWSKVYAEDMFSVFEQKGVMDQQTGKRYRDIILAKGGTEEEIDLVKQFLKREPNEKAFLRSLGLDVNE